MKALYQPEIGNKEEKDICFKVVAEEVQKIDTRYDYAGFYGSILIAIKSDTYFLEICNFKYYDGVGFTSIEYLQVEL